MRTYQQFFALITLFCLLFELCEPSTNFIRTPYADQKQEQNHDHSPNLKNFETHAAHAADSFEFEFKHFYSPTYLSFTIDSFRPGYIRAIFQPPKAA